MALNKDCVVIGLAGPFGSGCSTSAKIMKDYLGYSILSISSFIREELRSAGNEAPTREQLQAKGNEIRNSKKNPGALIEFAINKLEAETADYKKLVVDGIRNVGEIELLRHHFGRRFYLVALECSASERWERLKPTYGDTPAGLDTFTRDNENDRDQENSFGQQVALCVDSADALIINDNEVPTTLLRKKLTDILNVLTGDVPRFATADENLMNFAYSASHASKCLKRQVGAIVVVAPPEQMGHVVGQGFNDNPMPTAPCVDEPRYGATDTQSGRCYRDIVRQESFSSLVTKKARCPQCGTVIGKVADEPPWNCVACGTNLERCFWPERAMTLCTAIHAEVAALLSAGERAHGATLYTTTFPCFQCAEKIIQCGIRNIVFTEPYPDIRAGERLEIAHIAVRRFEGVRSGRFDEIFSRARPYIAAQRRAIQQG
jgi:deoxycytidylate deaminase